MKRVVIVHGWDGSPEEPMHKWLKKKLEEKEFNVTAPKMPHPGTPEINSWVGKLNEVIKNPNKETYLIGHSIGCQTILRYLERLDLNIKIGGVVLIAPFMHLDKKRLKEEGTLEIARPWIEKEINFNKVIVHTNKFVSIFSDNDPFVSLKEKEIFKERLNSNIIIEHNKGHFDPSSNIKELPSALKSLLQISK